MFDQIPEAAINFVREVFGEANDSVTAVLASHPSMHEETLDHQLVMKSVAVPATFFAKENVAVEIETHWLGGRRHFGRWEIADIAIFVLLRKNGVLIEQKVALLQTKRLYSKEIPVTELDDSDYVIGIARLSQRTDPLVPLTRQRAFSFSDDCVYGAMASGSQQVRHINEYIKKQRIPVFYNFYNPPQIPCSSLYPASAGAPFDFDNSLGCRVLRSTDAHDALANVVSGKPPTFKEMAVAVRGEEKRDKYSAHGWRLETFVADEVLRCREGRLFKDSDDQDLAILLGGRTAPIQSAISITIDLGTDGGPREDSIQPRRRKQ